MRNSGAFTPTRVPFGFVFILILLRLLPGKAATVLSFVFVESGLTGPLLVELFYGVQIHNPVVRGSAPAL